MAGYAPSRRKFRCGSVARIDRCCEHDVVETHGVSQTLEQMVETGPIAQLHQNFAGQTTRRKPRLDDANHSHLLTNFRHEIRRDQFHCAWIRARYRPATRPLAIAS